MDREHAIATLPLRLGPLAAEGFLIRHSGIHWLCAPNHLCRANEMVAYCTISLEPTAGSRAIARPFDDEMDLQIAFAPRIAGHLKIDENRSPGGFLNHLSIQNWDAETVLADLEPVSTEGDADTVDARNLRLLIIAGRRMTGVAEVHGGLMPGWHSRRRAWWCDDGDVALPTLLSLGICDVTGVILGDRAVFADIFEASGQAAQIVYIPDHPILPCAPVLTEQFTRTPGQLKAITADLHQALAGSGAITTPHDWMFAGAILSSLGQSPMRENYTLLTPSGLRQQGAAETILLSLSGEGQSLLRHKTLGYTLQIQRRHQMMAGPSIRSWLASSFEPVQRTIDDIRQDYLRLVDAVAPVTGARFMILNRMSTSGQEDIWTYAPFDHPMGNELANIAAKELNLMLHDIAAERDISIVDVDAIAADIGGSQHLPDGIHQSGTMQAELRAEILYQLHQPGRHAETPRPVT